MRLKIATMAAMLAGLQWLAGCNAFAGTSEDRGPQEIPWPTKSWLVSTPEEQGMESGSLARLIDNVGRDDRITRRRIGRRRFQLLPRDL